MSSGWKLLKKKKAFTTDWVKIEEWTLRTHQGKKSSFFVQPRMDVAIVMGVTADNKVLIIKQYYVSLQKKVASLVAGYVEKSHTPLATAKKELKEEAGCVAKKFVYLGEGVMGKWITSHIHYYLALGLTKSGEQELEAEEDIEVLFVPMRKFRAMVEQGKLPDAFVLPGVYRALNYLKLN